MVSKCIFPCTLGIFFPPLTKFSFLSPIYVRKENDTWHPKLICLGNPYSSLWNYQGISTGLNRTVNPTLHTVVRNTFLQPTMAKRHITKWHLCESLSTSETDVGISPPFPCPLVELICNSRQSQVCIKTISLKYTH